MARLPAQGVIEFTPGHLPEDGFETRRIAVQRLQHVGQCHRIFRLRQPLGARNRLARAGDLGRPLGGELLGLLLIAHSQENVFFKPACAAQCGAHVAQGLHRLKLGIDEVGGALRLAGDGERGKGAQQRQRTDRERQ